MSSKKAFANELSVLATRFIRHRDQYEHAKYNETDLRNEFLNKVFKALGWDIDNEIGASPADRDVWLEKGDCQGKRPDYNFRLSGKTCFYLEAKAPHVNAYSPESVYQAKSYSWSTTESLVSISILSNFKEILVFDTTLEPDFAYPDRGLIFKFGIDEYGDQKTVDKLWLLSREEMSKGTLLESLKKDKSREAFRTRPDERLLELLNEMRIKLAASLFKENKSISLDEIQDIAGTLINRFIFIRVLEDRGTIDKRELKDIVDDWEELRGKKPTLLIKSVRDVFDYINENFNGKLFHGDPLQKVSISADVLADVIKSLYGRKCPFAFNRLDANTLGHIYEKFLSCEITRKGKTVVLEEKASIRKSGGVFYTPKEVVEFMCKDAVGEFIRNADDLASLRFLDPSCGSGTFLLTAYKMLLDEEAKRQDVERSELPFSDKRRLLLSSIFGIDIDGEASKVAVLSLCLMALENESHISKGKRLLPNLHLNLIKADSLINESTEGRNSVSIETFPPRGDGLAILGNPPYISTKRDYFSDEYKAALEGSYASAVGHWDTYALFLERCEQWKPKICSLIVPKPILTNETQAVIRNILSSRLAKITDVGSVFEDAAVEAVVLESNESNSEFVLTQKWSKGVTKSLGNIIRSSLSGGRPVNIYASPAIQHSFSKIESSMARLDGILESEITRGIEKGKNALHTSSTNRMPCFAGAEINSLIAGEPEKYIQVAWTKKATYKDRNLYQGPKVLVRRVTNDLIASIDYSDSLCLNTLYVLNPLSDVDPEFLAIYLNSTPVKFWFKYKYVNDDALFPYVRKNQIEDIPVPDGAMQLIKNTRSLCNKIVADNGNDSTLLEQFDHAVMTSFGLNVSEVAKMKSYLAAVSQKAA